MPRARLPRPMLALLVLYSLASLAHFAHNAELIAYYPNMPHWLTRENVYLAWLAVAGVGLAAVAFGRLGWPVVSAVMLALYGALGLDGLGHYAIALCSEHTWAANLTIWCEVVSGLALLVASSVLAARRMAARGRHLALM